MTSAVKKKLSDTYSVSVSDDEVEPLDSNYNESDMNHLISSIKDRLKTCKTVTDKINVISVVPKSWSIKKTVKELAVSEYIVKKARRLVEEHGIIPNTTLKKAGNKLSEETKEIVLKFYESDEVSRLCPGQKDCITILSQDGAKEKKQKRLVLCNLKEAYEKFKSDNPNIKIGFSKFCMLRPKWCILAGRKGTHSVCVCQIHQNFKLMINAVNLGSCKEVMAKTVCDLEKMKCMFGNCEKCPGIDAVKGMLPEEIDDEDNITYKQWVSTDRCDLVTVTEPYSEFKEKCLKKISSLRIHHYISKSQTNYLKKKKESLKEDECIVLGDFSENFTFIVQDEVQSFHWVNNQATLHPFCIYYKNEGKTCCENTCFMSDYRTHNTASVYAFQKQLVPHILLLNDKIKKVIYFSDGASGQYKNRSNFANLCKHEEDFGICAEWHFFATSHGKSSCDGIGGTVKRLTAKASLQRTFKDHILTVHDMFQFCSEEIKGIKFFMVSSEEIKEEENRLATRFLEAKAIKGTRKYHCFIPNDESSLKVKRTSVSKKTLVFQVLDPVISINNIKVTDKVAVVYDKKWYIATVTEISKENNDVQVTYFKPSGPSTSFTLNTKDQSWVPVERILLILSPVEFTTATGRTYNITQEKSTELSLQLLKYLQKKTPQ